MTRNFDENVNNQNGVKSVNNMAPFGGLRSVREVLLDEYFNDVIDDIEFFILYEENMSKCVFPYWKYDCFNLDEWVDVECITELRFSKEDLFLLLEVLGFPDKFICSQRTVCSGLQGLCILLKRLAYPCRYTDMVARFGRNPTELCFIFNHVLNFVFDNHHHRLNSWNQPFLSRQMLDRYAQAIFDRGAPLSNCFGFIDGTLRPIARSKQNQRVVYNGHKPLHGIKFQSVVLPNGLIASLHGPFEGRRHDSTMLYHSGLLTDLQRNAWSAANGQPLCLYGDPAYTISLHLQAPFRNPVLTPQMREFNTRMSEVRVSVEWMFGTILNYFKFIDFKKQNKIGLSPVGKMYLVCSLLQNAHTCIYGNIVSDHFKLDPPSIHDYFV